MKKILLILVILLIANTSNAVWNPFSSKKPEKQKVEPVEPSYHNYSIQIDEGVFYLFKGGCKTFVQIGIIDFGKMKLFILNEQGKAAITSDFLTIQDMTVNIKETWGKITEVEFGPGK